MHDSSVPIGAVQIWVAQNVVLRIDVSYRLVLLPMQVILATSYLFNHETVYQHRIRRNSCVNSNNMCTMTTHNQQTERGTFHVVVIMVFHV